MRKFIAVSSLLCTLFLTVGCTQTTYRITAFDPEAGTVEVSDNRGNVYPIQATTNPADVFGTDQNDWPVKSITRRENGTLKVEFDPSAYSVAAPESYEVEANTNGTPTLVLVKQQPSVVHILDRYNELFICSDDRKVVNCSIISLP